MYRQRFNSMQALRFKHFTRRSYALFSCIGREVLICTLSVATLTYAKADGMSTKPVHQTAAADTLGHEEVKLDEVLVTGSRAPLTALQSAKIVSVITRDDIQRAEAASVNDLLKLATGVDVRQRGGFGVQTDISINGGTFDQITILLNGVNISSPQTGHNAADFPVSLSDIERIEVLEGASARVFGSSAFNGAINIVTRPDRESCVRLSAEGGSFGSFGGDFGVSLLTGSVSQKLSGGYTQSDGGTKNSDFKRRRAYYTGSYTSRYADLVWQAGLSSQDYGASTFYSAKFDNQWEATRRIIVGYYMVMYMASMSSVPASLYESANLDGAGRLTQFFQITIPLVWTNIRTTLTFFIISTINMAFLFVKAMTSGGPNGASDVALNYMYSQKDAGLYGYSMAIGVVIFLFSFALSACVNRATSREPLEF